MIDPRLLDPAAIEAELCRRSFKHFVKCAWRYADSAPLVWNDALEAICLHLQAVADGRIQHLLINVPPGFGKSLTTSVLWPAWLWARDASKQMLTSSYELGLATRDAVKARDLMRTEWYKVRFGSEWEFADSQDQKTYYSNTQKGHRNSISVGSRGTGYRGDLLVVDDPLNATDAYSDVRRAGAITWFDEGMQNRFNDMSQAHIVCIMQRLHQEDLSGHILRTRCATPAPGRAWQHLCLPMEFEPTNRCVTYTLDGAELWRDPRSTEGQLLFEGKFPADIVASLKTSLGGLAYAGQYQQRPTPASGGMLQREWLSHRWYREGEMPMPGLDCRKLPTKLDSWTISADCTFKAQEDSDYVAISVWARCGPDAYLIDMRRARLGFVDTVGAINDLRNKYPQATRILVEDKANGSAVVEVLRKRVPGIIAVEPNGGKESRVAAVSSYFEAGNVWLPLNATWVGDYVEECLAFPKGAHDDMLDSSTQALSRLLTKGSLARLEALARL